MKFNEFRNTLGLLLMIAGCPFSSFSSSSAATNALPDQVQAAPHRAPLQVDVARLQFSVGVGDIVKMVKANVHPEVIKTFINHSRISYNPSAQEVIALKKLGVPNEIIITLVGHRSRAMESPQPSVQARPMMTAPRSEEMPWFPPSPYGGGYPFYPYTYPVRTFAAFGSLSSFNNSYPTFVNGHPVYAGYYLPSYTVLW
jgi:hypothetical protein